MSDSDSGVTITDEPIDRNTLWHWMKDNCWLRLDLLEFSYNSERTSIAETWLSPNGIILEFTFSKDPDSDWVVKDWGTCGGRLDNVKVEKK